MSWLSNNDIPIGQKGLAVHLIAASKYNREHEPSFWWWFSQTLLIIGIMGVGLAFMWG